MLNPGSLYKRWRPFRVAGIQVTPHQLRATTLEYNTDDVKIISTGSCKLPERMRSSPLQAVSVTQILQNPALRLPEKLSAMAFALPDDSFFQHSVKVSNKLQESELEIALLAATECLIPYQGDALAMDYRIVANPSPGTTHNYNVTVCPKATVELWQAVCAAMRCRAAGLEPAAQASQRARKWYRAILRNNPRTESPIPEALSTALGAALGALPFATGSASPGTPINLLPWRRQIQRHRIRKLLLIAVSALVLGSSSVLPLLSKHHSELEHRHSLLLQQRQLLSATENKIIMAGQRQQQLSEFGKKLNQLSEWRLELRRIPDLLTRIAAVVPSGISMYQFSLQEGKLLLLQGQSDSISRLNLLLERLQEDNLFSVVSLQNTRYDEATKMHRFRLEAMLYRDWQL